MEKGDPKLDEFLKKVDNISSIVKDLNASDETTRQNALNKADSYLTKVGGGTTRGGGGQTDGFNKTQINKITDADEAVRVETRADISPEEFMKQVEEDSEKRKRRRAEELKKALVWKNKGNEHFKRTEFNDALQCYTEAIKLSNDQPPFYSNRAQTLIKLSKFDAALEDCEVGLKLDETFVKLHIHRGRALMGLKQFTKARDAFNQLLNVDKKQGKVVAEYMKDLAREEQMCADEEKIKKLMTEQSEDNLATIQSLVSALRKGSPTSITECLQVIMQLISAFTTSHSRTLFRTSGGFQVFIEHAALRNFVRKEMYVPAELNIVCAILTLLSNVMEDEEENTYIVSNMPQIFNGAIHCMRDGTTLNQHFQGVQTFHRISQFERSRANVIKSDSVAHVLEESLRLLTKGGDLALIAMGVINNLALHPKFVPQFEEKLCSDFIPGVVKMMDLLSLSLPHDNITKTFLPVMATSISTIANFFANKTLRKRIASGEEDALWRSSRQLLARYSTQDSPDKSVTKVVLATLSMLLNLTTTPLTKPFTEECSKEWCHLSSTLLDYQNDTVVEYCCGVLNHIIDREHNNAFVTAVLENKLYERFIRIVKHRKNIPACRFILKCLAVCGKEESDVHANIYSMKALPSLIKCVEADDERMVGNAALLLSQAHNNASIVDEVAQLGVIQRLLRHATNDQLSEVVRHNCAIAIGKYCLAKPACLQQLRDLHGLEILHEYEECFTSNFINGSKLIHMHASNLPRIGITDFEHIKKITEAVREQLGIEREKWDRSIALPPKDTNEHFLERKSFCGNDSRALTYEGHVRYLEEYSKHGVP